MLNKVVIVEDEYGLYKEIKNEDNNVNTLLTYRNITRYINQNRIKSLEIRGRKAKLIVDRISSLTKHSNIILHCINTLEELNNTAYFSGFKCFLSGVYPKNSIGIKHIYIENLKKINNIEQQALIYNSNINSSIISYKETDMFGIANIKLDNMDSKFIKFQINGQNEYTLEVKRYKHWKELEQESTTTRGFVITIDNYEDIIAISSDAKNALNTGEFKISSINTIIKDQCMFLENNYCTLKNCTRCCIADNEDFFGSSICYRVEDITNLKDTFKNKYYKVAIKNNCNECSEKASCAKCIRFSDDEDSNQYYCDMIRNNKFIKDYIKIKEILKSFIKGKSKEGSIYVLTPRHNLFYHINTTREMISYYDRFLLFLYKEESYLYVLKTMRFYKIDKIIAMWIEAFQIMGRFKDIQDYFIKSFGIGKENASILNNKIHAYLKSINLILEEV